VSDRIARLCWVSGRVQGVFFRASTRQRASELGVAGYAKNLPDGRVEVLAVGGAASVRELCEWLWVGPPGASVTRVEVTEVAIDALGALPTGFLKG